MRGRNYKDVAEEKPATLDPTEQKELAKLYNLPAMQVRLDKMWKDDPKYCRAEGLPKVVKGLDAWSLLCLKSELDSHAV